MAKLPPDGYTLSSWTSRVCRTKAVIIKADLAKWSKVIKDAGITAAD